jgi:DNA-binding NarL/FixJ family response regulator
VASTDRWFGRLAPEPGSDEAIRRALRTCRDAVGVDQVIRRIPQAVVDGLGLLRVVVCVVDRGLWTPTAWSSDVEITDRESRPMTIRSPEADMARRGLPIRAASATTVLANSLGWAGTPITSERRTIAFILADRSPVSDVNDSDRDRLGAVGEAIAAILERTVLLERARANSRSARALAAQLESSFDDETMPISLLPRSAPPIVIKPDPDEAGVIQDHRLLGLLTARELEVLELLAGGARNAEIAASLVISDGTVKSHVKSILRKLHAGNRTQAISKYFRVLNGAGAR